MSNSRTTVAKAVASMLPVVVVATIILIMVFNSMIPFRPFDVRGYHITPNPVCAGETIQMTVERRYTRDFDELFLTESWVAIDVPGIPEGTRVITESAYLPPRILKESPDFEVRPSPLLKEAPVLPGKYVVRIEARALGTRWGVLPAEDITHLRTDPVMVKPC